MTTTRAMESAGLFASRNISKSEVKTEKADLFSQLLSKNSVDTPKENTLKAGTTDKVKKVHNLPVKDSMEIKSESLTDNDEASDERVEADSEKAEESEGVSTSEKTTATEKDDTVKEVKEAEKTEDTVNLDNQEEGIEEKLQNLSEEIKDMLCNELGLSKEELEKLLEKNQISVLSLFNKENLMEFVMQASGTKDMSELLVNEEAVNILKAVTDVIETVDVTEYTGIPKEEFTELVDDVLSGSYDEVLANISKEQLTTNQSPKQDKQPVPQALNEYSVVKEENNLPEKNQDTYRQNDEAETVSTENTLTIEVKKETESFNSQSDKGFSDNNTNQMLDAFADKLVMATNQTAIVKEISFAGQLAQVREIKQILGQITNQIKLTVTKETQSIQMQLNPENLGRVNMTITSKGGVMTAQFIVENEVARETIESQMKTLIQSLNDQGLKVEELEVTTNSFSFDQQGFNQSEADKNPGSKKTFKTNFFSDDIEETSETQAVLEDNNTVSYLA